MFKWLFGEGNKDGNSAAPPVQPPLQPPQPPAEGAAGKLASGVDERPIVFGKSEAFDPSILERIAAAARELKDLRECVCGCLCVCVCVRVCVVCGLTLALCAICAANSRDLIELAKVQEKSWQDKFHAAQKDAEAKTKEYELQAIHLAEEEKRKTLKSQTEESNQVREREREREKREKREKKCL
jgi:hypothetical protein